MMLLDIYKRELFYCADVNTKMPYAYNVTNLKDEDPVLLLSEEVGNTMAALLDVHPTIEMLRG